VDTVTREDTLWANGVITAIRTRFFTDSTISSKRFNLILTLSNDNYLGYCSGTSTYEILSISPDTMYIRHELVETIKISNTGANRLEWRYLRLVAKK